MKNSIIISMLILFQSACSISAPVPAESGVLMNFADLAAEITVEHEVIEATAALADGADANSTD